MEAGTLSVDEADCEEVPLNVELASDVKEAAKDEEIERSGNISDNGVADSEPVAAVVYEPLVPDVTRFSCDVQHGYRIFCELLADQYKSVTRPFIEPVDVEGLGLWDYYTRIETPMSFRQIESKFKSYLYQSITEVVSDMRLILENCYRYNGSSHWVSKLAQKLENILDQKLALLNRSLRDKVSLQATMAFRSNKNVVVTESEEQGGRRRRSGRSSYLNGMNSDQTSRLVNHLILEEEETQKELRRQKEKVKKEANEALMQELNEWEKEMFTPNVLNELRSVWEIPSIGSFLWLFQEALNLPELNYTEFESGLVMPHKSSQMARIFSALLVTPNQRKSLHKKSPMRFAVWEKKLKERMDLWYMTREAEEFQLVGHQIGLDHTFFEIMGNTNPLEKKSYIDLSLHQRVLILKALCDECLDYEPQLRDYLGNTDTTPFREVFLGNDGANSSYVYFPVFEATDIRIYKQAPLPSFAEWYRRWKSDYKAVRGFLKPGRVSQSKSRKSEPKKSGSTGRSLSTSIEEGFELVCHDVETLRGLCEKFSDHATTPSGKKRRGRPPRKQSEKNLHDALATLLQELEGSEGRYFKARTKGMVNLMKDWKTVEEPNDSGDESIAQLDDQTQDDQVEDAPEESLLTPLEVQPPVVEDGPNTNSSQSSNEKADVDMLAVVKQAESSEEQNSLVESSSLSSLVTRSKNRYKKITIEEYQSSASGSPTPVLEANGSEYVDTANETSRNHAVSENSGPVDDIRMEISVSEPIPRTNTSSEIHDKVDDVISKTPKPELIPRTISISGNQIETTHDASGSLSGSEGIRNSGTMSDFMGTKDSCDIQVSGGNADSVSTEAVKENDVLRNGTKDTRDVQGDDGYIMMNGDVGHNVGSDFMEVDDKEGIVRQDISTDNFRNSGKIMDSWDNGEVGDTGVHQNGKCEQLADVGGAVFNDYEPASKRHCSAESHNTTNLCRRNEITTEANNGTLETSHQSPERTALNKNMENCVNAGNELAMKTDHSSSETSHQPSVETTVIGNVPKFNAAKKEFFTKTDDNSLKTSHQTPTQKTLNENVQGRVDAVSELLVKANSGSLGTSQQSSVTVTSNESRVA